MIKTDIKIATPTAGFSFKSKTIAGECAKITVTFHKIKGEKVVNIRKRSLSTRGNVPKHTTVRKFKNKWLIEQVILLKDESLLAVAHYTNLLHK